MRPEDLDPLLHALGLDEEHAWPWRDHYVTGPEAPELAPLLEAGLLEERRAPGFLAEGDRVFGATRAGRAAAIAERDRRHPPKKPTRGAARYESWLRADGAGVSFGEYLRRGMYKPDHGGSRSVWEDLWRGI